MFDSTLNTLVVCEMHRQVSFSLVSKGSHFCMEKRIFGQKQMETHLWTKIKGKPLREETNKVKWETPNESKVIFVLFYNEETNKSKKN